MATKNNNKLPYLLTGCLLIFASLSLSFDFFAFADRWLSDQLVKHQAAKLPTNNNIVVLDIDESSIEQMLKFTYAGNWPWPRAIHAELIEGLSPYKPKAIVFDILFSEPDKHRPDADAYFNEVIAEQSNVYLSLLHLNSSKPNSGKLLKQLPNSLGLTAGPQAIADAKAQLLLPMAVKPQYWRAGSINFSEDSDGIGRRYELYRNIQGWRLPSLPAKVASDLGATLPNQPAIILRWQGDQPRAITTYPYAEFYRAIMENNQALLSRINDKIIIIGSTASGLHDLRATPIDKFHPAVYMLATAIDNLITGQFYQPAPQLYRWSLSAASLALVMGLFWRQVNFKRQVLLSGLWLLASCAAILLCSQLLIEQNILLHTATPMILALLAYILFVFSHGLSEHMQRRQAIALFSRFVDPTVVNQLISDGQLDIEQSTQSTTLTVLFSDIRGFTSLSEKRSAEQIVSLLNEYFGRQLNIVFNHRGTLDKFIGDCIMAFWGAPIANDKQAIDAVNAALAMADELLKFRQTLPPELQDFDVGIGIHTGPAVVGMIGAQQRVDYTAIGDTVNLASRIEGLTKGKARILVSEETKIACEQSSAKLTMVFNYCGEFAVKGRQEPVKLYEPVRTE